MKGKKPFASRLKRAFITVATAFTMGVGTGGIELLPRDPVTDTQKITTFDKGTPEQRGINISLVDQFWKATLDGKMQYELAKQLVDNAAEGDSWRVRAIIEHETMDLAVTGRTDASNAMNAAALNGHTDVIAVLQDAGVRPDGNTFLHALRGQHYELAEDILAQVGLNQKMMDQGLKLAAGQGHTGFVTDLLARGADPGADDSYSLRAAVDGGYLGIVRLLLEEKRSVVGYMHVLPEHDFDRHGYGYGFDHHFASPDYPYPEDYFKNNRFNFGHDIHGIPFDGFTANELRHGVVERPMERVLVDVPAVDVNALYGRALTIAAGSGDLAMAKLLIDHGADINAGNGAVLTAAVLANDPAMVALLVDNKADTQIGLAREMSKFSQDDNLRSALDGKYMPVAKMPNTTPPPSDFQWKAARK
jgi:hypothetical protein